MRAAAADSLETRVAIRKRQLITEIIEHKKNSCRSGAVDAIGRLSHQLLELSQIMTANGQTSLSPSARVRLAQWIER